MKNYITIALLLLSIGILGVTVGTVEAASSQCVVITQNLTYGSKDVSAKGSVTMLQDFLRTKGYLAVPSTGYFGPATLGAVKSFQMAEKISAIGTVGPLTRAAIIRVSCAEQSSTVSSPRPVALVQTTIQPVAAATVAAAAPQNTNPPYWSETFKGWVGTWGNVSHGPFGSLIVNASPSTTGAEALFPDSKDWKDYRYTANVIVSNGTITLYSRYVDANNYLACTFTGTSAEIQERLNGEARSVAVASVPGVTSWYFNTSTSVAMQAKGDTISCSSSGQVDNVTYTITDPKLRTGGIGIQTWQTGAGSATLELKSVQVDPV